MITEKIKEFEEFIKQSFTHHSLPVERCSQVLFSQLVHMPLYGGVNYPFQFVEKEIVHLEREGKTWTKPAMPFKRGKIQGFMHKHFVVPGYGHIAVNTQIAWELKYQKSTKLPQMVTRLGQPYAKEKQNTPEELWKYAGEVAREIIYGRGGVIEKFESRKGTGDWLVFIPHEGKNYYLCIAKHEEEEFVFEAIKHCVVDFPFLNEVLNSRRIQA